MLHTQYQGSMPIGFRKEPYISLRKTFDHQDNPPSGLGDVVESKMLTDDRHHRITIARLEPMAQVS